jgi:hypothetical protein
MQKRATGQVREVFVELRRIETRLERSLRKPKCASSSMWTVPCGLQDQHDEAAHGAGRAGKTKVTASLWTAGATLM